MGAGYQKILLTLLLMVLLVPSVEAIGIGFSGDSTKKIEFEPSAEHKWSFFAVIERPQVTDYVFDAHMDSDLGVDIAKYVTFNPQIIRGVSSKSSTKKDGKLYIPFSITLNLPESIDVPGLHKIAFSVTDRPLGEVVGVRAVASARMFIQVRVLSPGIDVRLRLDAPNVNEGQESEIRVIVENWGLETVRSARAEVNIFDSQDNKVATIFTDEAEIPSGQNIPLPAVLNTTGLKPGTYTVKAKVFYDGQQKDIEGSFIIGTMTIKVIDYTRNVTAGRINPFEVELESSWNDLLSNVYVDVAMNGKVFTSSPTRIKGLGKETVTLYVDATEFETGPTETEFTVHYSGFNSRSKGEVMIIRDKLKPLFINTTTLMLVVLILALLSINVFFLTYWKKNQKKK